MSSACQTSRTVNAVRQKEENESGERTRERERGEKINDVRDSWCIVIEFGETRWHGEDKGRYSMDAHARQTHML